MLVLFSLVSKPWLIRALIFMVFCRSWWNPFWFWKLSWQFRIHVVLYIQTLVDKGYWYLCPLLSGSVVFSIVVFWSWWNPFWSWWKSFWFLLNPFWFWKLSWQFRRLNLGWFLVKRELSKVWILCFNFLSILSDFLSREKLTQKWPDPKAEQFENFNFQVKKWPKHQFFQTTKCQMVILV